MRIATAVEATRDDGLLAKLRVVSEGDDATEAGEALASLELAEADRLVRRS